MLTVTAIFEAFIAAVAQEGSFFALFENSRPKPVLFIAFAAFVVVVLAIFVLFEVRRHRLELINRLNLQWTSFEEMARTKKLHEADISLLKEIHAKLETLHAPDTLLRIPAIYDRAVEFWLKKFEQSVPDDIWMQLERMRRQLGFKGFSNETSLSHTRQIGDGQKIRISCDDWETSSVATLESCREEAILLRTEQPIKASKNATARISFSRQGDGEYKADVPVIYADLTGTVIHVAHTAELSRQQLRMWVRVSVSIPGKMMHVVDPNGIPLSQDGISVTLMDLSGGGAMVSTQVPLVVDSRGELNFQAGDSEIRGLGFILLRAGKMTREGAYVSHLCWDQIEMQAQERIMRFVFERQRAGTSGR